MTELEGDFNLILGLTHPELAAAATRAQRQLRFLPSTRHTLWPSIFTGIAVIVNRITPPHTDRGGEPEWYDLLVSAGSSQKAVLKLDELDAELEYRPGTIVLLCGKCLTHSVDSWGEGDRICLAHFLKANVFKRLGIRKVGWSIQPELVQSRQAKRRRTTM
jgi:hypothetical protein